MPTPQLLVIGAGHVGKAVGELGHWLGLRTLVWDDRTELTEGAENTEAVDVTLTGSIEDALATQTIAADDSIVIVTRNVGLDLEIMPHVLGTAAGYIGLMGSKRRWDTTRGGLVAAGLSDAELDRVRAPIGIEIQAETPEEIAVSIVAEVIGHRRGV